MFLYGLALFIKCRAIISPVEPLILPPFIQGVGWLAGLPMWLFAPSADPVCNKYHEINKLSVLCKDNGDKFDRLSLQIVIAAWTTSSLGKAVEDSAMACIDIKQLFYSQFLNSYNINCLIDHSHGKGCHLTALFGKLVQSDSLCFCCRYLSAISTAGLLPHKHLGGKELWAMFIFHRRIRARLSFNLKKWEHGRIFAKNTLLCK